SQNSINSSASSSNSSGLKIRLRCIQSALRGSPTPPPSPSPQPSASSRKRTSVEASLDDHQDIDDTDSEIEILPPSRRSLKTTTKKLMPTSHRAKKLRPTHEDTDSDADDEDDVMFDAAAISSSTTAGASTTAGPSTSAAVASSSTLAPPFVLSTNVMKRSERILDPKNPDHARLIAAATKAGPEYYDSDADDLPGKVKETSKPELFRNVKWGALATDYSDPAAFPTEPEFTQFVPGRYELLPTGVAADQKAKLLLRLTDATGRARIFTNPPPRSWTCQAALTALNKRTVQQIRRNTAVRFRDVVQPYVREEREWILAHLEGGRPVGGWKVFVAGFNAAFEGKVLAGGGGVRQGRSHSSLTKEVERFGGVYAGGEVPGGKGKGKEKRV
ncbi:hypothetical protein C7974DRAFT_310542, partial [Boeremia exigua]|uniref:uncharacterized protein n=1 Tax=Boeremia exigua TaxID=749465 RepID=UPI001E8D0F6A